MSIAFKSKIAKAGFGMLAAASMLVSSSALALTAADVSMLLNAGIINATQAAALMATVSGGTTPTTGGTCYQFTSNLTIGSRGEAVRQLQMTLNANPATKLAVNAGSAGSMGNESDYFGPATAVAVKKFQASKGISQVGNTGPQTRVALNASCSTGGGVVTPTPTTGPVSAMLSTMNPSSGTIIAGQATANLAQFTFNGTGTVTSVTLSRTGVSSNDTLKNVYLYEGSTRLTDAASVTTAGTITFSNPAGIFMVNGMKNISVRADIKAATSGQTVGVNLTGYTVSGATMTSANLMGNVMSVASALDLAAATLGATNTVVTGSVDAGTSNYTVWGNTLSTTERAVMLKGANFRVIGSAETGALQNARLIVDGAQVGMAVASVTANSTLSFDFSNAPLTLTTTGPHTIEVRADVVGGANRSFYLSLQNAGDLMLTDSQYGVNLMLTTVGAGTSYLMNSSGTVTINAGTLALSKDSTFNTTTVTSSATNVTIGRYTVRSYGEAVKVMQMQVTVNLGTGTVLQDVGLYVNGAQIASVQDVDADPDTLTFDLGSNLIVPAGQTVAVEVRADMIAATSAAYTGTIATNVAIPVGQAQGQSSYALYPTGTALTSATTTVTAGAATANITTSASFLAQPVAVNASNARVGSYVITAGTTEGLRVTNLAVTIDQTVGAATDSDVELTDISSLRGTVTVSGQAPITLNSVNPQATNNFSTDFTIPAGSTATVDLFVDVTNATASETIQTNLLATARGASSNVVLTAGTGIAASVAGQNMTVGSGSLINSTGVTIVTTQATSTRYVLGASAVEPMVRYSFKPTSGAVTIEELTFTVGGTANLVTALSVAGTSGGSSCSVSVPSGASTVTVTGCSIPVPYTAGGTDIIVTPTINMVGITGVTADDANGATVDLTDIEYNNGTTTVTASLDGANDDDDLADTAASAAIYPVASIPTLTFTGSGSILTNGEIRIGTVTVSASAGGNINLETLPITYTLTGGALSNTTAGKVFVIREGSSVVVTTDDATDATAAEAAVVTFTNNEIVNAGSSRTFEIWMNIDTVTGDNDAGQFSLAPSSDFLWDDVNGGNAADLVGTFILNYPTNSVTLQD